MSDILSHYFDNVLKRKMKSLLTTKKNSKFSHQLSDYGLSLSENNILTLTPQKCFSFTTKNKNKALNENIKVEINEGKSLSPKNNINTQYQNIIKNNKLFLNNIINKRGFLPINNFPKENSPSLKNIVHNQHINNTLKIPKIVNIKKEEENKINSFIEELMENKQNNRKIFKKKSFKCLFNSPKQPSINPLKYIDFNLSENAHKPDIFKSYNLQVKLMGNEKYRNILLDDINCYNQNIVKFKIIKSHVVYSDKDYENKKDVNMSIKEMLKGSHSLKKKKKLFRNFYSFSFESKYNLSENKRNNNFNSRLNSVSKSDIDKISKYIKINGKKLSFDKKLNLILLKAQKTSNFIKKRTEEYERINKLIMKSIV